MRLRYAFVLSQEHFGSDVLAFQASIDTPSKAVPPVASNFFEVYDVPLKVEETYNANPQGDDQDIYYIFYEDKPESAPKQPPGGSNFSPPSGDDIKYDTIVNNPMTII